MIVNKTKEQQIADGKVIYTKTCVACHQAQGQGLEGAFPPLAKSDFLNADVDRAIDIVLHGKQGEVTVNGKKYSQEAEIIYQPEYSTCAGFSVPISSVGNGSWDISLSVTPINGKSINKKMIKDI